ncbi:MAG: rhomboid family intramembrane serine protease [Acidobacteriia bacterium]|nr:rhomboid family intramembrane serine protease [Terriglobia bacterium]
MNLPSQLWFKWQRLKTALREAFGSREQSYETVHRMCPHCRGLIERNASICPLCGGAVKAPASRAGTGAPGRVLGGLIPVPSTATSALVAAIIALYGISWYLTQEAAAPGAAVSLGGIDGRVLIRLGAKFGPLMFAGEWWRLVTAIFLHAGLLHIGMNLWCLFDLGPTVESLFSTTKFIVIYLVTGILGFVLSLFWSPFGISIGASGAILGLIGALIGASFHHGSLGKDLRSQLWRWVIYIGVFGLFFSADNAAHLGGLISGLTLGYFVPEGEPTTRASENFWSALAIIAVVIIAGSFALMALQLNRPIG